MVWFAMPFSSLTLLQLYRGRGNEQENAASVSVVFISMNKLQTH
jgi:hypothetical protein